MSDPTALPELMQAQLRAWIDQGVMPCGFLRAVLENDLRGACEAADATNIRILPAYVSFLYNFAPVSSWGSPAKVRAWIRHTRGARDRAFAAAMGACAAARRSGVQP